MKPQNLLQLFRIALLISFLPACNSVAFITPTTISATATLPPPDVKRIAFYIAFYGSSKSDIYVVNADGSQLTHLAEKAAHPVWSPDGRYIVFLSDGGIALINADGNNQVQLAYFSDLISNLAWSSDNQRIIFSSNKHDGTGSIYLLNVKAPNSDPKHLNRQGVDAQNLTWSPDGQQIAFSYRRDIDSPDEIAVLNVEETLQSAEGGDWIDLTEGETPVWSPDGKKIAFSNYQNGNYDIYVMGADGNNQTRLTQDPADDWSPAWSPDGQQIAFFSKRDPEGGIYVMNVADALQSADGSDPTRLTQDQNYVDHLAWSPDGQQIAFTSKAGGADGYLYVINSDGSHLIRLTDMPIFWPQVPTWSPQ